MGRTHFEILYRHFLTRIVELDSIAPEGDMAKLMGQFVALLLLFGSLFGLGANQKAFPMLLLVTLCITGIFAAASWDSILPTRGDLLVLGALPVRTRTIFIAKVAAVWSGLAVGIVTFNLFPSLMQSLVWMPKNETFLSLDVIQLFVTYWAAMLSAGSQLFTGIITIQLFAAAFLPRALSPVLRILTIVGLFVLPVPHELPDWRLFAGVVLLDVWLYMLAVGRILNQSAGVQWNWVPRSVGPFTRFSILTIARSQEHRLILSLWIGLGMALIRGFREGTTFNLLLLSCFALAGFRVVTAIPFELPSNWIFRLACDGAIQPPLLLPYKVPFACSYLPGKSQFHLSFLIGVGLVQLLRKVAIYSYSPVVLLLLLIPRRRGRIIFEEEEPPQIIRLSL